MTPKSIELIAFDKNQKLQYEGKCKLRINRLSKMLSVEPINEEFKMISALFKWNFIMNKNILFVFAENKLNDFMLVFDNEERCKIVCDFICNFDCKEKTQNKVEKDLIKKRFWIPFGQKLSQNDDSNVELKQIIKEWIEKHKNEQKEEYLNLLKENNVFDIVFSTSMEVTYGNTTSNDKNNAMDSSKDIQNEKTCNPRKRKHADISCLKISNKNDECDKTRIQNKKTSKCFTQIVKNYKFVHIQFGARMLRRLLIFTSPENCFEFSWSCRRNLYYCNGCKKSRKEIVAIFDKDENGEECIKMEDSKHVCDAILYIPEKYIPTKIYKKPDYEILENCNTYSGKILIMFDKNDKQKCWEFLAQTGKNTFQCRQCKDTVKLWNEDTKDEYIELKDANHSCKFVPYLPKKYYQFKDFVLSPNFKIHTVFKNGKERKRLIILDKTDKNLCYIYSYCEKHHGFVCQGCRSKGLIVSAKILTNSENENYVLLSQAKHICELQKVTKTNIKKFIILRPPEFELIKNTENEKTKLLIFDPNDRSFCYIFTQKHDKHYCRGCHLLCYRDRNAKKEFANVVRAKLCIDNDDKNYVQLVDTKHICKPYKYEPEKYAKKEIQKSYDFFFFRRKRYPNSISVALYHPENKNLCFGFSYIKLDPHFRCNSCLTKGKKSFNIRIEKDADGKEYFKHDYKNHICEPIKVSSMCPPNFIRLKKSDLVFEKKDRKLPKTDHSKIFLNFELCPNSMGTKDGTLFIFHCGDDRNFAYKYFYSRSKKFYICNQIKKNRCHAKAEIHIDESGEKCFISDLTQHKCEPVKYEKEGEIIEASNFQVVHHGNGNIKIFVFTTPELDECYEFGKTNSKSIFKCLGCNMNNIHVTVKLCKEEDEENGNEFLQMSNGNHVCAPRKYIKEKYEPKIIPSELFEFHPNTRGEKDKRLVVFTSEKKEFMHEYCCNTGNFFYCLECISMKKRNVYVKLDENKNGQKIVQCGHQEHICEPRKYDPKKYIQPKIISSDLFILNPGKNGEEDRYLSIFTSEEKKFAYLYSLTSPGYYQCLACRCQQKIRVSAKIIEDENGVKALKLGESEHVCKPEKYDPKKFDKPQIISSELFELHPNKKSENDKYLFLFTSEEKKFAYKYSMLKPGYYRCLACKCKKKTASAHLMEDENGIKTIKLGENEHVCEPQKYDPKKYTQEKIVSSDLFILNSGKNGEKDKYLSIFTSEEKKFAYQYSLTSSGYYICLACRCQQQKTVSAKIIEDKNGIKTLILGENEHVCKPEKYDPKKFDQPKIIFSELFELHPNKNGEKDKHLSIFTSEEKKFAYKYSMLKPGYYRCLACKCKKKTSSAILIKDENGIKTIKLGENEHVCKPEKYDPTKI